MIFTYNSTDYTLPDDLSDITLKQQVDWYSLFGYELEQRKRAIDTLADEMAKELDTSLLAIDRMQKALSFYTTIPLPEVVANISMYDVAYNYSASAIVKAVELFVVELEPPLMWDASTYQLYEPEASVSDPITSDEFVATCRLATYLREIYNGSWQNAIPVVAAYLRNPGEVFDIDLIDPEGARCLLFEDLPLDLAIYTIQQTTTITSQLTDIISIHVSEQTIIDP